MTKDKRDFLKRRASGGPDPGAYTVRSTIDAGPKYIMGERTGSKEVIPGKNSPGPGAYSPKRSDKTFYYSLGVKLTSVFVTKNKAPGPGAYDQTSLVHKPTVLGAKFSISQRMGPRSQTRNSKYETMPGPGNYAAKTDFVYKSSPRYGFGASPSKKADAAHRKTLSAMPGPGAYNLTGIIGQEGPSKTISARFKDTEFEAASVKAPGPGAYEPNTEQIYQTAPGYKLGSSKRSFPNIKTNVIQPPPNKYNPDFRIT